MTDAQMLLGWLNLVDERLDQKHINDPILRNDLGHAIDAATRLLSGGCFNVSTMPSTTDTMDAVPGIGVNPSRAAPIMVVSQNMAIPTKRDFDLCVIVFVFGSAVLGGLAKPWALRKLADQNTSKPVNDFAGFVAIS